MITETFLSARIPVIIKKAVVAQAKAEGITASDWVRQRLVASLKSRGYRLGKTLIRDRRIKLRRNKRKPE